LACNRVAEGYAREPGIVVRRTVTPEDGMSSLFEVEFWHQFKTYASVERRDYRRRWRALAAG
jgi:hypothetical protein